MEKLTKGDKWRMFGGTIGFLLMVALLIFSGHLSKKQHERNVIYDLMKTKMVMEAGYAQGQMDAIKGTIRVRPISDSSCVWLTSPWGNLKPMNDTVTVTINYRKP